MEYTTTGTYRRRRVAGAENRKRLAAEMIAAGKTHVATVVKSYLETTYYHIVPLAEIAETGIQRPAPFGYFASGARGRLGIQGSRVDWETTVLGRL